MQAGTSSQAIMISSGSSSGSDSDRSPSPPGPTQRPRMVRAGGRAPDGSPRCAGYGGLGARASGAPLSGSRSRPPHAVQVERPLWLMGIDRPLTLHEEIEAFVAYLAPTPEELEMRRDVFQRVADVIRDLWPTAQVEVFGSSQTGLCLPTSDIDITVTLPESFFGSSPTLLLAEALRARRVCERLQVISNAKIPLVKLWDAKTRAAVDVSFNATNGPATTAVAQAFVREYPQLRPLALVLKYFLHLNCLNEPYLGGIGSYTLILMIVSFLQQRARNASEDERRNSGDYGRLLIDFLHLYGVKFNYFQTGISVTDGGAYFSKAKRNWVDPSRTYLLCIQDPIDDENDVGRNSYDVLTVRQAFQNAYQTVVHATSNNTSLRRQDSVLGLIVTVFPQLHEFRAWTRHLYTKQVTRTPQQSTQQPQSPHQQQQQQSQQQSFSHSQQLRQKHKRSKSSPMQQQQQQQAASKSPSPERGTSPAKQEKVAVSTSQRRQQQQKAV